MNEDDFRRAYAQIEDEIKASEDLRRKTKESLGIADESRSAKRPSAARGATTKTRKRTPPRRPAGETTVLAPAFRTAFAACLAVAAGVSLLFATGTFERIGGLFAGNSFSLVAYAEEPTATGERAGITLDMFHPSRTSAGYLYDASSDTVDSSVVAVSRYYAFNMTAIGRNVESIAYSIEGEGVSYGSWKSTQGNEGAVSDDTSKSFVVPYNESEPVIREIRLNYVLEDDEKAEFDRLYAANDPDSTEILLAECDAKRLRDTTITATATFLDGTVQTKSYGFSPIEGFENRYRAYLTQLTDTGDTESWASLAGEPALFQLVEKSR